MAITQERLLKLLEAAENLNRGFELLFEDIFNPDFSLLQLQFDAKDLRQRLFDAKSLLIQERASLDLRWKRNENVRKYRGRVRAASGNFEPSPGWKEQFQPKRAELPSEGPSAAKFEQERKAQALGEEMNELSRQLELGYQPSYQPKFEPRAEPKPILQPRVKSDPNVLRNYPSSQEQDPSQWKKLRAEVKLELPAEPPAELEPKE